MKYLENKLKLMKWRSTLTPKFKMHIYHVHLIFKRIRNDLHFEEQEERERQRERVKFAYILLTIFTEFVCDRP